jgi:hypothetical protein
MSFFSEYRAVLCRRLTEKILWAAWGLTTVVLAITGPFGNYSVMPLPERLVFWALLTAIGLIIGVLVALFVERRLGTHPYWPVALLTSLAVTIVMSPPLRWLSSQFNRITGETAPGFGEVEAFAFFLTLGICSIRQIVLSSRRGPAAAPLPSGSEPIAPVPEIRILNRLEPCLRAGILWVSVRDHYVDVCTETGEASILMRFSDALSELDGVVGLRIHRSHWIADAAVAKVVREGGRLILVSTDGKRFPVSKTYREAVEARHFAKDRPASGGQA